MIDDERKHTLVKIVENKKGVTTTESDHNTIVTEMNITWNSNVKQPRHEIFNFKNKECLKQFENETNDTNELSQIIDSEKELDLVMKKFLKRFDGFTHKCFKKIKVTEKRDKVLEDLYKQRSELKNKTDDISKEKLTAVEKELADKYAE